MSKFDNKRVMPRFIAIAMLVAFVGVAVLCKAAYIIHNEKDYWEAVAQRQKRDSVTVKPNRGNILSSDGELMAGSLPEYKIYLDYKVENARRDTVWADSLDYICEGLHKIFPSKTAEEFKEHLEKGRKQGSRHWAIWKKRIDYDTYKEVCKLPVFNMSRYAGGFYAEEYNARRRPFGSLAQRTVGALYAAKDSARFGLELAYDSVLRGENGLTQRRKILNKYMNIPIVDAEDGADIVTTIDIDMQDFAERAIVDELKLIGGNVGVVIVMEVKTGDIKAIVNMTKCDDGSYQEIINKAISYRCEPGSVFKTASILVALDDGVVDTSYVIHTGCGVMPMHGRRMKDHNWHRGGYGDINVARSLEVSSNVGVSYVIDNFYGSNPEKYVSGLYRVGIGTDLELPIEGYAKPIIRMPKKNSRGAYTNWSKTALAWMSIGYETQIPPINTVTFYNAIANNGKMVRPRFVKGIMRDGEMVEEMPVEVIKEQIARPEAVATMQTILRHVVSQGLGRKAGSPMFAVAGKTGTAQVSKGAAGYHSGTVDYWLSFSGYFPADDPQYTCLVCIQKTGLPASGGGMCGVVFRQIAENIMSRNMKLTSDDACDSSLVIIPNVKRGNMASADFVLDRLNISTRHDNAPADSCVWGEAERDGSEEVIVTEDISGDVMPDVAGMGARDAVFLLESMGLRVSLTGAGKVVSQSIRPGECVARGSVCELTMM